MKEFLAQYLLNLWIYGSQAWILYFAGRKLVTVYAARKTIQLLQPFNVQAASARGASDIRNERSA